MPMDKTGRNLHPGQIVDVCLSGGMFQAHIHAITEPRQLLIGPARPPEPGRIKLVIGLEIPYTGSKCDMLYLLHTPKSVNPASPQEEVVGNAPPAEPADLPVGPI